MTSENDEPKRLTNWELDQLRFSAQMQDSVQVASKDLHRLLDEITAGRVKTAHPLASMWVLPPLGGAIVWLWAGDWRWLVTGLVGLFVVGVVGAVVDSKRGAR